MTMMRTVLTEANSIRALGMATTLWDGMVGAEDKPFPALFRTPFMWKAGPVWESFGLPRCLWHN